MSEEIIDLSCIEESPPKPLPSLPTVPPSLILSPEQDQALHTILEWSKQRLQKEFKLGGYAGTGKTTLVKTLLKELKLLQHRVIVCAFTGKAVHVLQKKGITAQTLHSLMYNVEVDPKTGEVSFYRRDFLESSPTLIIVDEASMISTDLYYDLKSFGKLLLFVGDPGQLEPVGDNPNLMLSPDFVLQTIHRQAQNSPIITLATKVRQGGKIDYCKSEALNVLTKGATDIGAAVKADQLLCATNKVRNNMNNSIRSHLGLRGYITPGEKLIVLKNNLQFGVFNGMLVWVEDILETKPKYWVVNVRDEVDRKIRLNIWREPFENPLLKDKPGDPPKDETGKLKCVHADYGYVITCHKSQGSEWDHVMVFDQYLGAIWDMKRWRYTAITRAAKQLTYYI